MKLEFVLTRNEKEITVFCDLTFIPASRGHRDRYGAPEEPDEPAQFELDEVADAHGNDYDLTDSEYDEVMEKAWEAYQESKQGDYAEPDVDHE